MNSDQEPNTTDEFELTCTYRFSDLCEFAYSNAWRSWGVRIVTAMMLFIELALIVWVSVTGDFTNVVLWLELLTFAVVPAAMPALSAWGSWRAQRGRMGRTQHIHINAAGIHQSNDYGDSRFRWNSVKSLDETKNLYLVRLTGTAMRVLLPKRALDVNQRQRLRDYVTRRISAARDGYLSET